MCRATLNWHISTKTSHRQILNGKTTHQWKSDDVGLIEASVCGGVLLEAQEHELEPDIGQHQHEQHVGERKAEPARKVYHAAVLREEPSMKGEG